MSDYNTQNNRAVWFYEGLLAMGVAKEEFGEISFGLLELEGGSRIARRSESDG